MPTKTCKEEMNHNSESTEKVLKSSYRPHLDVPIWLKTLELEQYLDIFKTFNGVEDLLYLTGRDVLNLGVTNSSHRARLVTSLAILKEKYRKALARRSLGAMNRMLSPNSAARTDGYINSRTGTEGHWTSQTFFSTPRPITNDHNTLETLKSSSTNNLSLVSEKLTDVNENFTQSPRGESSNNSFATYAEMGKKLDDFPWYHGRLKRKNAEALVIKKGQFLVRDCISQPGDFVLTCNSDGTPLHFMINRIVLPVLTKNGVTTGRASQGKPSVLFQFEDEQFASVPDLVEFYVNHGKPVTELSKCVISEPVIKQQKSSQIQNGNLTSPLPENLDIPGIIHSDFLQIDDTQPGTYAFMNRKLPPVPSPPKRMGLPNLKIPSVPNLANRPLPKPPSISVSDLSIPKIPAAKKPLSQRVMLLEASRRLLKSSSEGKLSASDSKSPKMASLPGGIGHYNSARDLASASAGQAAGEESQKPAPSKPQRAPSLKNRERPTVIVRNKLGNFEEEAAGPPSKIEILDRDDDYHEYCDIDYDLLDNSPTRKSLLVNYSSVVSPSEVLLKNSNFPVKSSSTQNLLAGAASSPAPPLPLRKNVSRDAYLERDSACVPDFNVYDYPVPSSKVKQGRSQARIAEKSAEKRATLVPLKIDKKINLEDFEFGDTFGENGEVKPFDAKVWEGLSRILLDTDPMSVGKCLTKIDCDFLDLFPVSDRKFEISENLESGLTLVLLPQGEQLRKELRARSETLTIFVIGSIVKCSEAGERVRMLKQWIETCRCLRFQVGNEFAFDSLMQALSSTQISGLRSTWQRLRTDHTPSAVCYETVLKPAMGNLGKMTPNVSSETEACVIPHLQPVLKLMDANSSEDTRVYDWEDFDEMFALDALWSLLESSRKWFNGSLTHFKEEAVERVSLPSSCCSSRTKEQLEKVSQTEFQMKFLWGSKGALVEETERVPKMRRLLTLMANKVEMDTSL